MMEDNKWQQLWIFLKGRVRNPFKHPEFVFYFILVIVGVGAIGIYSSIFSQNLPECRKDFIISNMASYFLAVIATGSVELIFIQKTNLKRAIFLLSIGAIFLNTFLFFLCVQSSSYYIASIGLFVSLTVWWLANAENTNIIEASFNSDIREEAKEIHGKNW
jgi:predicted neutral ceramidase superfamily lipid hydrolase